MERYVPSEHVCSLPSHLSKHTHTHTYPCTCTCTQMHIQTHAHVHKCTYKHTQVRCILWSADDSHLISCSMDGAIYEWNVQACKRENESVLKGCSYTSLAITPDLRTTFAVGSDRTLKEIILQDSNVSTSHLCMYTYNAMCILVLKVESLNFSSVMLYPD